MFELACPKVYCFVQQQFTFDRQLLLAAEQPVHLARLNSKFRLVEEDLIIIFYKLLLAVLQKQKKPMCHH